MVETDRSLSVIELEQLKEAFPPEAHKKVPGSGFDYIEWAMMRDRLDAAVPGQWEFFCEEPVVVDWETISSRTGEVKQGRQWSCRGYLSIRGQKRWAIGESQNWAPDSKMMAQTICFKRCCALWGIAAYLYSEDLGREAKAEQRNARPLPPNEGAAPARQADSVSSAYNAAFAAIKEGGITGAVFAERWNGKKKLTQLSPEELKEVPDWVRSVSEKSTSQAAAKGTSKEPGLTERRRRVAVGLAAAGVTLDIVSEFCKSKGIPDQPVEKWGSGALIVAERFLGQSGQAI